MSHHGFRGKGSDEWYTPPEVFEWLGLPQKEWFDPFPYHGRHGMEMRWLPPTWLNPPYSIIDSVVARLPVETDWALLVWCRMETGWAQAALQACDAVLFPNERIWFIDGREEVRNADGELVKNLDFMTQHGSPGAPSMILAKGSCVDRLRHAENTAHGTVMFRGL